MFETIETSEIPLPKELAPNGEKLWSYIHVQLHKAWFYAEVEHVFEGLNAHSMYILSSVSQLESLASNPSTKLTAVHISAPKHLIGNDCWRMYRLRRVLRGLKKNRGNESWITIFEIYDEEKMIYDPPLATTDKLKNIEVVLEF